ncbi:MAG: hypothetical protein KDC54_08230, partial [Lewinella sp.]|nr:hypothetical protein [Lewinella sp.]
ITPVDSVGHGCCWTLDFNNLGNTTIYAVSFTTLHGESIDHTEAPGYFTPDDLYNHILVSPNPLGPMPNSVPGLVELCFSDVFMSPVEVAVDYYQNNNGEYEIFCSDTLRFDCPPEPPCLAMLADTIGCDTAGYFYSLDIQVPAGTDFPVGLVKLNVTDPPSLAGAYPVTFSPALQPGDQATLNFNFPAPPYFSGTDSLCYILTAHNGPGEEICCFALDTCIVFPPCDPCPEVTADAKILSDSCCYRLAVSNNYPVPGYFTNIQTTILTPGVVFSTVEYPLGSGWSQVPPQAPDDILWQHSSGAIPTPLISYDLFDFCLSGVTTTDSVCIAVNWLNDAGLVCQDTVKVFCPECLVIYDDEITCDTMTGIYNYQFNIENWSDGFTVNAIGIINDDPRFDVAPTVLTFPPTLPGGSAGPLNFDIIPITGMPGDTLCLDLVLREVINDTIHIECCYLTHCIILPPCEGGPAGEPCDELLCVAPPDVTIGCEELPLGFDFSDPDQLAALFGEPTDGGLCPGYTWQQTGVIDNRDDCGGGTFIRMFTVYDLAVNPSTNTCEQVITIQPGPPSYQIRFPADQTTTCDDLFFLDADQVDILLSGCDQFALTYSDDILDSNIDGVCFIVARTYQVLDWCEWDGAST